MPKLAGFTVKCGRCGAVFTTPHCAKLDHFGIYRVTCPRCNWPGRYLASELRPAKVAEVTPPTATPGRRRG